MAAQGIALTEIFPQPLVKIDSWLIPPAHAEPRDTRMKQATVAAWLDLLGEKSSQAQQLDKQITTSDKLRNASDQHVYLYIDRTENNGRGALVGFLRTGRKSLYFHLASGDVLQVTPECILDFYVVENQQRMGIGKKLFEFMLKDKGLEANQLAIDKPSPKLLGFMKKHFGLSDLHVHSNNYAVATSFFDTCPKGVPAKMNMYAPAGRYSAQQPSSQINSIIHGGHVYKKASARPLNSSSESLFGSRAPSPKPAAESLPAAVAPAVIAAAPPAVSSRNGSRAPSPVASTASSKDSRAGTPTDLKFYHTRLW